MSESLKALKREIVLSLLEGDSARASRLMKSYVECYQRLTSEVKQVEGYDIEHELKRNDHEKNAKIMRKASDQRKAQYYDHARVTEAGLFKRDNR